MGLEALPHLTDAKLDALLPLVRRSNDTGRVTTLTRDGLQIEHRAFGFRTVNRTLISQVREAHASQVRRRLLPTCRIEFTLEDGTREAHFFTIPESKLVLVILHALLDTRLTVDDELVLCITGNGLKTIEAVKDELAEAPVIQAKVKEVAALVEKERAAARSA